ncbi:hypothetical protein FM114_02105 [Luteococcus japonicus LSP_Lj1]|uniref:Uncharacterized protein n=1 Tax=Luteococcus japonicus LSP_Lj1 TaxID=1255658 RepID=A0A1R4IIM0_9ACTN|nr:hypothetical protein FM114_02105 [Luteococcus japonicus LSP_Lj1]
MGSILAAPPPRRLCTEPATRMHRPCARGRPSPAGRERPRHTRGRFSWWALHHRAWCGPRRRPQLPGHGPRTRSGSRKPRGFLQSECVATRADPRNPRG